MAHAKKIIGFVFFCGCGFALFGCDLFSKTHRSPCAGILCSDHGVCLPDDQGDPQCHCDSGYHAEGLACVKDDENPCDGVDCSGHGTCQVTNSGAPFCSCDQGYHAEGLECVQDEEGPCKGISCSGFGTCYLDDHDQPYCVCVEGYHAVGLYCVMDDPDPCDGVDCSGHGTCYMDSFDKPRCQCDQGFHEEGLDCVPNGDCDPVALRLEALQRGQTILNGVTLASSTSISKINADPDSYADKHIQVEGLVLYICAGGNRVVLMDPDNNYITVTANFNVYMTPIIEPGTYMVADGMYRLFFCRRGRHLNIGQHGARVGTIKCNSEGPY